MAFAIPVTYLFTFPILLPLENHNNRCDQDHQIGDKAHEIQYGNIESGEEGNADGEGIFQGSVIILKLENGQSILQIGQDGEITYKPKIIKGHAQAHAQQHQNPLHGLAFNFLDGHKVANYADGVLHSAAITLQNNSAHAVNKLAETLDEQHAFGAFAGGAERVRGHGQKRANIADDYV